MKVALSQILLFFICIFLTQSLLQESPSKEFHKECSHENETSNSCCPPFSICSCGIVYLVSEILIFQIFPETQAYSISNPKEVKFFPKLFSYHFWHPPKQV
jgi:hypothetical protein